MDELMKLCFEFYYVKYICQRNMTSDDNEMTLIPLRKKKEKKIIHFIFVYK